MVEQRVKKSAMSVVKIARQRPDLSYVQGWTQSRRNFYRLEGHRRLEKRPPAGR